MTSETELQRLVVRLTGDGGQYNKMISEATSKTKQAAEEIDRATNRLQSSAIVKGELVAHGVELIAESFVHLAKESLAAFKTEEYATFKLQAALKANGNSVESAMKQYEAFTDAVEEQSTASRPQILTLLQMAQSYGVTGAAAEKAVKQALGAQSSMNMGAEEAIRMTARLQQGDVGRLGYLIPGLNLAKENTEKLAIANKRLDNAWQGTIAEAKTLSGTLARFHATVEDLHASIGGIIAEVFKPLAEKARELIRGFLNLDAATRKIIATTVLFAGVLASASTALAYFKLTVLGTIKAVTVAFAAQLLNPWILLATVVVTAAGLIIQHFGGVEAVLTKIGAALKPVWIGIKEIGAIVKEIGLVVWNSLIWAFQKLDDLLRTDIAGVMRNLVELAKQLGTGILNMLIAAEYGAKKLNNLIKGIVDPETWEQFKARRWKELWGDAGKEAGEGLLGGINPALKAINKALHPQETVLFFSTGAYDRLVNQLNTIAIQAGGVSEAVNRQKKAAGGGIGRPQQGIAGFQFGRWMRLGGSFKPKGSVDSAKELRELEVTEFEALGNMGLANQDRLAIANNRAFNKWIRRHPDAMPHEQTDDAKNVQGQNPFVDVSPIEGFNPATPNRGGLIDKVTPRAPVVAPRPTGELRMGVPEGNIHQLPHGPVTQPLGMNDSKLDQLISLLREQNEILKNQGATEMRPIGIG